MPDHEHANDIDDVATAWAAKAERGLTPEEQAELDLWFKEDSRHLGAFVRVQAAWIHAERATALGTMPDAEGTPLPEYLVEEQTKPNTLSRRMVMGGGGVVAASIAAAYMFGFDRHRTLESGVGETRHITLEGGTALTLDTDTRVDIALSSHDRKLSLIRGKLFLDVTRQQELPLSVKVGNLLLETLEGAFSLQSLVNAPILALVTEGSLIVSQSQGIFGHERAVQVRSGHALTLPVDKTLLANDVRPVANSRREQLLAWRDGMLAFGGELLGEAVRAFDRYGSTRIVVADPDLARQKVTGLFKADDPRGFATAVAASFGGIVTSQGEVIKISMQ